MADVILLMRMLKRRRKMNVPRYLKVRGNPLDLGDDDFCRRYKLNKDTYLFICDNLRSRLSRKTSGYPVETQVLCVLRLLGTGSLQDFIADENLIQVSQTTVSRNLTKVCEALFEILPRYLSFPTTDKDITEKKNGFSARYGFPGIVGVLDCTHVEIQKPVNTDDWSVFVNGTGKFSIKVQLTCDVNCLITDVVARWPGGMSSYCIWKKSGLSHHLSSNNEYSEPNQTLDQYTFLIANSDYSPEQCLLAPYREAKTPEQVNFNEKLEAIHKVIGKCKLMLKTRFQCLNQSGGLIYSPAKVCKIVMACAVLHNICVQHNVPLMEDIDDMALVEEEDNNVNSSFRVLTNKARTIRDSVACKLLKLNI